MSAWIAALLGAAIGAVVADQYTARNFTRWLNDPDTREWLLKCWGVQRERHVVDWSYTAPGEPTTQWTASNSVQ